MALDQLEIKQRLGARAAQFVQDGMYIGLGTGSTAVWFIENVARRCREENLLVTAVASSELSYQMALQKGIPVLPSSHSFRELDLTVDGADEIDVQRCMIKGKGGALLREKILALASKEFIVVADESKQVDRIGQGILPIEVVPFGHGVTLSMLEKKGIAAVMRLLPNGTPFMTDGGHWIFDLTCPQKMYEDPQSLHGNLLTIPGVVETGLFLNVASRILIGLADGRIETL